MLLFRDGKITLNTHLCFLVLERSVSLRRFLGTHNLCFGRDIEKIYLKYALVYGGLKSSCIVMCWSARNLIILLLALIKIGLMLRR